MVPSLTAKVQKIERVGNTKPSQLSQRDLSDAVVDPLVEIVQELTRGRWCISQAVLDFSVAKQAESI